MKTFLFLLCVYLGGVVLEKLYLLASGKAEAPRICAFAIVAEGALLGFAIYYWAALP